MLFIMYQWLWFHHKQKSLYFILKCIYEKYENKWNETTSIIIIHTAWIRLHCLFIIQHRLWNQNLEQFPYPKQLANLVFLLVILRPFPWSSDSHHVTCRIVQHYFSAPKREQRVISGKHLKYKMDDMLMLSLDLSAKCFTKLVAIPNLSYHIRMPFQVNFK